jgi:hypothetical protein
LRPSSNPDKEAQRRASAEALAKYLEQGGTITVADTSQYKREAGTLSREEVVKTFAYQSQIGKIKKEASNEDR